MKSNDKKIYLSIIIVSLAVAAILAAVSMYSLFSAEPRIKKLLESPDTLAQAYIELREPQIFAGYKNWDYDGKDVFNTIRFFDKRIYSGTGIRLEEKPYLGLLLDRRHSGAMLGIKTAVFFLLVAICSCIALFVENKSLKQV